MNRSRALFCCLVLAAASCQGGTLSFTGNFDALGLDTQWDPFLASFATSAASDVAIQSFGYAGGTNAQGQAIPGGGFAAIVAVFRGLGPGAVFVDLNDGSGCTGCSDPVLQLTALPAGTYTLALTPYANYPWAYWDPFSYSTLGDGFIGLGFLSGSTADFAVDITSAAFVPEPATVPLVGTALLAILGLKKWSRSRPGNCR